MANEFMEIIELLDVSREGKSLLKLAGLNAASKKAEAPHMFLKFYGGRLGIFFPVIGKGQNLMIQLHIVQSRFEWQF